MFTKKDTVIYKKQVLIPKKTFLLSKKTIFNRKCCICESECNEHSGWECSICSNIYCDDHNDSKNTCNCNETVQKQTDIHKIIPVWDKDVTLDRKVLSIDVGIINLCYCVIATSTKKSSSVSKYKILHWDLIDLITDHEDRKCTADLKSGVNKGKCCTCNATLFESGFPDRSFCSRHKPKNIKTIGIKTRLLCDNLLVSGKRKGQKCGKKASFFHKKKSHEIMGYCAVHSKKMSNIEKYNTVDNISDIDLKIKLFTELDKLKDILLDVDDILIEYQPPIAREKMKMVSFALHDYFILRTQIDQKKSRVKIIRSVDAKHKLTVYDGPSISCPLKGQYSRNKWYSKKYCMWLLEKNKDFDCNNNWIKYFSGFKKKDDLADSFMQGIWYILYGQYGKKPIYNEKHQKVVFREQNWQKFKKIRAVKPGKKQIALSRISLSNIKYYHKYNKSLDKFRSSIEYYFGDVDSFQKLLKDQSKNKSIVKKTKIKF
jgi:hypothetical protein